MVGSTRDITQRKGSETALHESEAEFRLLTESMPQIVWIADVNGANTYINSQWVDYTGLTLRASLREGWVHAFHADDLSRCWRAWQAAVASISTYSVEARLRRADGVYRWWLMRAVPLLNAKGDVLKWIGTGTDIQGLKEENAELETRVQQRTGELNQALDLAEKATKAKSAFLAAMSHEIRTPMNGVVGMIEVLEQTSLQGHQLQMTDLIRESAFSLLQIIDDILDFSRIEAGRLEVGSEPLPLALIVENVAGILDHLAVKQNVRMSLFVDPSLPETVVGDAGRLRQVLINLAGNAIKFSAGQQRRGRVSIRVVLVESQPKFVEVDFIITDNGIGIDEETLAGLFRPFAQADTSTTRVYGGSGLGLSITDALVRLMGGTISVRSVPGKGSTFNARIRFAHNEPVARGRAEAPAALKGLRCRIVGDDAQMAGDFEAYLKHAGLAVERSPDLTTAHASAAFDDSSAWLVLPGSGSPAPEQLGRSSPAESGHVRAPCVLLEWGRRRLPLVEKAGWVVVDVDCLSRATLLSAMALAAGRLQEGPQRVQNRPALRHEPEPREQARLNGRLILVAEDNETNRIVILRQLALLGYAAEVAMDGREALQRWRSGLTHCVTKKCAAAPAGWMPT